MRSKTIWFPDRAILTIISGFFVLLIAASPPSFAATSASAEASKGDKDIRSFRVSIGEYYHVPQREVVAIQERGISEEELPVVFFIAQRAHVKPGAVVALRLRGMKWMDITLQYGLSPDIYYVPLRASPPYGHAYRYYIKHPKGDWKRGALRDADIVNQVNLKFISEHHRYAPEKVMKYRAQGKSFVVIDRDTRQGKQGKTQYQARKANKPGDYKSNDNNRKDNTLHEKGPGKGNG
jgi:hypothetical protein